jgi:two-component system sensor histidine kinase VicK
MPDSMRSHAPLNRFENHPSPASAVGAEEIARADTGRLAAIVESSDDAILSKTLQGIITSWNAAAERLFGYTSEEMVGSSILKIIPYELRTEEDHILSRVRAGQKVDHFETTRLRKDGRRVNVSITVSPVKDAQGRVIGASKIARDIDSQKELTQARATLAAIVESSDDGIISKDLDGVVTSWNRAAERLYGYSAAEMIGQSIRKIIPPELQYQEDDIMARIRSGDRVDHIETERLRKDGSRFEVSITVSPLKDETGRIVGASKIARDITPQREAQREKDRFLAILAHELRNPLAPIRNAVTLFGQPGMTEEQRNKAREIAERQIAHMAQLLDDLLDVARISTGRVELKRATMPLRPVISHAVEAVKPMMVARAHQLEVSVPEVELWIDGDEVRILQIVSNLLTNAAKYTDRGGHVRLSLRGDGGSATITVEDDGIGFDRALADHLFKLFSQAKDVSQRSEGGLGIGLALVREFVERHGGTVTASSEGRGKGSRFTVVLPLVEAPAPR